MTGDFYVNRPRRLIYVSCANYDRPCGVMNVQTVGAVYSDRPRLWLSYEVVWSILSLFIPLVILVFCNVCLIRAIRQSRQLHQICLANYSTRRTSCRQAVDETDSSTKQHQRITPTLIVLIIVFIVCVSPSALLYSLYVIGFGDPTSGSKTSYFAYQTATVIANCLFLLNFAVNFVLYCVVNVRFRCMVRDLLCCARSSPAELRDRRSIAYRPTR